MAPILTCLSGGSLVAEVGVVPLIDRCESAPAAKALTRSPARTDQNIAWDRRCASESRRSAMKEGRKARSEKEEFISVQARFAGART